jgi:hypothetical protein
VGAHTLDEVHDLFRKFIREGDINAVLTLYDREVVFCTRAGELKHGREALREEPQSGYAIEVFRRRAGMWRFLIGDPYTIGNLQRVDDASRMAQLTTP